MKLDIKLTPYGNERISKQLKQQNILVNGRRVGYCGTEPGMPVNFLTPKQCRLTPEEKEAVVAHVRKEVDGQARDDKAKGANVRPSSGGG